MHSGRRCLGLHRRSRSPRCVEVDTRRRAEATAEGAAADAEDGTTVDVQADGCTADQRKFDHRAQAETDSGVAKVAADIAVRC